MASAEIEFIPCETVETVLESALVPLPHYDVTLEPLHPEEAAKVTVPPQKKWTRLHCRPAAE